MYFLISSLEALLLTSALSLDAFIASFAYGTNKIKIPLKSAAIINLVCSAILGIALFAGNFIKQYIPPEFIAWFCFTILLLIAMTKFFDFWIKEWIKKSKGLVPKKEFTLLNFQFCIQLLADPTQADKDKSNILSCKEALALAVSLSLDGLAAGLGAGMVDSNYAEILVFSLVTGMIAVLLGGKLGNTIAKKSPLNLSWLSGTILLILAVAKVL